MAKAIIFWTWWQPFDSFCFETLSFLFCLRLPFFFLLRKKSGEGDMPPPPPPTPQRTSRLFTCENISQCKEMFKSTTGLETNDFQAVFKFLDTGSCWENIKLYDGQNNKKPKGFPQDVKSGKKGNLAILTIHHFSMYFSWLRNGFAIGVLTFLFDISQSTISRYL